MNDLKDLQALLTKMANEFPKDAVRVVGVEAKNFVQDNFEKQGYTDTVFKPWEKRKTENSKGRDITRYKTNRKGRKGSLNSYGRKNQDRAILTGFNNGGDKLRNSFRYRGDVSKLTVTIYTPKIYANRHNNGLKGMPMRKFIGHSAHLERRIHKKLTKVLDKKNK